MSAAQTDAFLATLAAAGLLTPARHADIRQWTADTSSDRVAVAKELVARGWLTAFQVREVAKGNVKDLSIGPYLLIDVLGEGGMGRVFRARHTRLGRDVALKVIRKEKLSNPQTINRFQQEIHAAAQLSHPNVVLAFDAESAGDQLFLSMEYVTGTDLTKLVLRNGPMPVAHACDAIRQAALGLQHAAERGLVHRDIKPSNLLYTPKGQVKVLDLGLAMLSRQAVRGGENANRVTQDGFVLGTPDFLAPEQAQNPAGVDIRADVYSLGATLFFLLTARVPFEADTPTEKLIKHITEPPPSVLPLRPDVLPEVDNIVRWMMAKRPEDRPQTPAQVAMALAPFCPQQSVPRPVQPTSPLTTSELPPDGGVNPFGDLGGTADQSEVVRVRKPKKASSLPLVLIAAGVLLAVTAVTVGSLYYFVVSPLVEQEKPLEDEFENVAGIRMKKLEPGTFLMGSPDGEIGREPDEGPQHEVTIRSPFYIAVTEVTRSQYVRLMNAPPGPIPTGLSPKLVDRIPATGVSWTEAQAFCDTLNRREADRRSGWEYRLPTEAEWEYAARAGTADPFPWGQTVMQYAHGIFKLVPDGPYGEPNPDVPSDRYAFENRPAPIGPQEGDADFKYRRQPNPWGLYDLHGNVWEWCRDHYGDYPADAVTDPRGPDSGVWRVLRGGAYDMPAVNSRSAARRGADPTTKGMDIGFRIVYAPKKE